jgi:hypothetical protein
MENSFTHSFTDKHGRQWTACFECNRGGRGNDKDKCACGHTSTTPDGKGCFCGTAIDGEPRKPEKISRSKARYQRYLEIGECFASFLDFCQWDADVRHKNQYA